MINERYTLTPRSVRCIRHREDPFYEHLVQHKHLGPLVPSAPEPQKLTSGLSRYFLPEAPGEAMLPGCSIDHILHSWSCTDRPKGYYASHLLVYLLKSLLLLRAPIKIVLLLGHLMKKAHKLAVTQNMHCAEVQNT